MWNKSTRTDPAAVVLPGYGTLSDPDHTEVPLFLCPLATFLQ